MMTEPSATDLREFYDGLQGRVVQRILRQRIRNWWPDTRHQRVLGIGYALPYLRPFIGEAQGVAALMPRRLGAVFWPEDKGRVALCDEDRLPIETSSVDKILLVHGLPGQDSLESLLRESWRVLTGQGRVILAVPSRTGLWARFDHTPFGHGMPWSAGQLRLLLKQHLFVPERNARALFCPPTSSRLMLALAPAIEGIGTRFFGALGGVILIEASKQIYAGTALPVQRPAYATTRPTTSLT